jgi:hemoglobin
MATLFEKYGGFAAISKIVMDFYGRVLDSDEVGPFFDNIEMGRQIDHQTKFIAQVLGGPAAYTNDMLQRVHAAHDIDRTACNEVARLLSQTLSDHGMSEDDLNFVMTEIETRSRFIINA